MNQLNSDKIKIALLCFRSNFHAWEKKLLTKILADSRLQTCLVVTCNDPLITKTFPYPEPLLYQKIKNFDQKRFHIKNAALDKATFNELSEINSIEAKILDNSGVLNLTEDTIGKIKGHDLDVVLAIGKGPFIQNMASCAKLGVWTHELTDSGHLTSFDIGFNESVLRKPFVSSGLYAFGTDGTVYPLFESTSSTQSASIHRVFNRVYWKMTSFFARTIDKLTVLGEKQFILNYLSKKPDSIGPKVNSVQNGNIFTAAPAYFKNFIQWKISNKIIKKKWILLFQLGKNDSMDLNFNSFKKIIPPKGKFWADPFVIYHQEKYFIFFEACSVAGRSLGNISLIILNNKGEISSPTVVLKKPYHLSYPFLFHWKNCWYMIPETAQNRTIELFKCVDFPDKWEFQYNLMEEISAVDTTLFEHNGKWWLFVNVTETPGASSWDELYLYFADDPLSKHWTPHPLNPVISDVTSSRPAGNVYLEDGKIYRPSQNSSYYYGYGLKINEITTLNETDYEEKMVRSIAPDWNKKIKAIHTLNKTNNLTIIDGIYQDSASF